MQASFVRKLLVLCVAVAMSHSVRAQNASRIYIEPNGWSIGTNVGLSDLWGDIGTKSGIQHYTNSKYLGRVAFMGGLFGRYTVHPCFALRFAISYGSLYASDKWNYDLAVVAPNQGADAYQRYARAQNVRDFIYEGATLMELTPMRFNPESKIAHKRGQIYFAAGIGYFHFEPYSTVGTAATWVKTYPLSLEGQGFGDKFPKQFALWNLCIPMAVGWKWDLGEHLNLGIEYQYRKTFTDYLDGVSGKYISQNDFKQHLPPADATLAYNIADKSYFLGLSQPQAAGNLRGNPTNKDSYSTIQINFYYKISTATHEWWH